MSWNRPNCPRKEAHKSMTIHPFVLTTQVSDLCANRLDEGEEVRIGKGGYGFIREISEGYSAKLEVILAA